MKPLPAHWPEKIRKTWEAGERAEARGQTEYASMLGYRFWKHMRRFDNRKTWDCGCVIWSVREAQTVYLVPCRDWSCRVKAISLEESEARGMVLVVR